MRWRLSARLTAGLAAALVWALAAGSVLFWVLHAGDGWAPVSAPVVSGPTADTQAVDSGAVARLLGAPGASVAGPAPDVVKRLTLRGIVTHGSHGAALIAVDGKPARPVRVGAALEGIEGGWRLQSVSPRAAVLVAGDQQARLELPLLSKQSNARDQVGNTAPGAVFPSQPANLMRPSLARPNRY